MTKPESNNLIIGMLIASILLMGLTNLHQTYRIRQLTDNQNQIVKILEADQKHEDAQNENLTATIEALRELVQMESNNL